MFFRLLSTLLIVILSGCALQNSPSTEPGPADVTEITVDETALVAVPAEPEELVPDACEILLTRLNETHPLLSSLDATLAGQTARLEEALDQINRPLPPPPIQECPAVAGTESVGNKDIIGALEWLFMNPPGQHYRARIDSGAETSSLSASNVVEFERDGDDWVRFSFQHDPDDDPINFELPIKRVVLIRQPSVVTAERRVVVEIDIRLGQELQTTEFTLTDRSRMTYPVLLGRTFLMDLYVVDVARSFTHQRYEAP